MVGTDAHTQTHTHANLNIRDSVFAGTLSLDNLNSIRVLSHFIVFYFGYERSQTNTRKKKTAYNSSKEESRMNVFKLNGRICERAQKQLTKYFFYSI